MRKGKVEQATQKVLCPQCDKSNFVIFRKELITERIYLHHAKCNDCGQLFVFKVNPNDEPFVD